jgi:O-antigen ligase
MTSTRRLWIDRPFVWFLLAILFGLLAYFYPLSLLISFAIVIIGLTFFISPLVPLIVMLVLAPLRTLIATESPLQTSLDIGQITFLVFIVLWWFHRSLRQSRRISLVLSPMLIAIILFTVVSGLTAFSAFSIGSWLTEWLKWITILVLILIVSDIADKNHWQWISFGLVVAGVGNAIVGLYIFFGGSGAEHLFINGRFFRAFGTFGQPNPFGGFMGLLLPIALMSAYAYLIRLYQFWRLRRKVNFTNLIQLNFYALASLVMLAGLIASWSRGAWLAFVISLAVMTFALPRRLWQSILLLVIALGFVMALWLGGFVPASIMQRVTSSTEELFSFNDVRAVDITSANYALVERLAHWQAALNMSREYPCLGVGFGNYEVAYDEFRLVNWDEALGHAHNYYLNILAETGMIGFLAYIGMWLTIVWITWRVRAHPDLLVRSMVVGLLGAWTYLAVHSLLDNLYVNNLFLHLGVMFGLLSIFYRQTQQSIQWE